MSSLGNDPILGHFDLIDTAKRKEESHQVRGGILRNLADNRAHGIGNCSVEDDRTQPAGLQDSPAPADRHAA